MTRKVNGGDKSNVVQMPTPKQRERERRRQEKELRRQYRLQSHGPLVNLPPVTGYSVLALLLAHLAFSLSPAAVQFRIISYLGFVPGIYTGEVPFGWSAFTSPFSYMLLHGGWMHVIVNSVMLAAFGAGVEKALGGARMLFFMIGCGLISAGVHFVFAPFSTVPVVGASGAVSGLFAAAIVMLVKGGTMPVGRYGIWPLVAVWVLISVLFGVVGGPGGESVAWAAHIGGFLGGFALLKLMGRIPSRFQR